MFRNKALSPPILVLLARAATPGRGILEAPHRLNIKKAGLIMTMIGINNTVPLTPRQQLR